MDTVCNGAFLNKMNSKIQIDHVDLQIPARPSKLRADDFARTDRKWTPPLVLRPLPIRSIWIGSQNQMSAPFDEITFATQDDGSTTTGDTGGSRTHSTRSSARPNGTRARHWQFTINNYDRNDERQLEHLGSRAGEDVRYLIYGKEVGATGTPHLQGHVSYNKQVWFSTVQNELPDGAHIEMVRLLRRHIEYCKKDGAFAEFGTPPTSEASKQGTRQDLVDFRASVQAGIRDGATLREKHPVVMARYPVFCRSVICDLSPPPALPNHNLRAWQRSVVDFIDAPVHPRRILFVVDERGNQGKSFLCEFLQQQRENVQVLEPGKLADLAYVYEQTTKILLFDVPRSRTKYIDYSFLESIKNGRLFSTKYDSRMIRFERPHLVVFMNEAPDATALSADRYEYITIR